jgi:hypothetical protein
MGKILLAGALLERQRKVCRALSWGYNAVRPFTYHCPQAPLGIDAAKLRKRFLSRSKYSLDAHDEKK